MTNQHNEIVTIIDANDLYLAQRELLGMSPRTGQDRLDYERIESVARCATAAEEQTPRIELFDLERGSGLSANPFYQWAERRGYVLHLTQYGEGRWEHEAKLFDHLRGLETDCHCPLVFVCGDCSSHHIRQRTPEARRTEECDRHLTLSGAPSSRITSWQQFASTIDLVEVKAVGSHYYRGTLETRRNDPEPADSLDSDSASSANDRERAGSSGYAVSQAQQAPQGPRRRQAAFRSDSQVKADPPETLQPELTDSLFDRSLPLVILIDSENVDSTLYSFHNPTGNEGAELDRDKRWDWNKLMYWIDQQIGVNSTLVVPILTFSKDEKEQRQGLMRFARFLRQSLGFQPQAFAREANRSVTDEAINKTLLRLVRLPANVMLISHDGDFFRLLMKLRSAEGDPERRIVVAGFRERMSSVYRSADWLTLLDLEHDMKLFNYELPNRGAKKPKLRDMHSVDDFDADALLASSGLFPQLKEGNNAA